MAPPSKASLATGARRKSTKGHILVLKLSPHLLRRFSPISEVTEVQEESPPGDVSAAVPKIEPVASPNGDVPTESASNTPAAVGTPLSMSMPPPTEVVKRKAAKRSAAVALGPNGLPIPKVRGKPGPKKKARLEDGSIDHSAAIPRATNGTTAHKLGPKANQGAINAGLRALDRSGKPCRRWAKGGFKLKSFTGVVWEIPRWKAPPKMTTVGTSEGSASGESSKENKDNSQIESEKSNSGADLEMGSTSSQPPVDSPAPLAPSAAPAPSSVDSLALNEAAPSSPMVTASA